MAKTIRVKTKKPKHGLDVLMAKLSQVKPKANSATGTFEFARSTTKILSRVRYVLKTGLEPLDHILGGGFAFGRIIEPYGLEGSGKSALAQLCVVQGQRREIYERVPDADSPHGVKLVKVPDDVDFFCIYIDNEQSVDDGEKLVINGTTIDALIGRCDTVDQMFKIIDTAVDTLVAHTAESGRESFILVVVDTIAGTSSKEEMTADWGDDDFNRQPKQLRQGFRRLVRKINRHNVCLICTNQVSDKFDKKRKSYGSTLPNDDDFSSFGGRALKFFASQRIFFAKVNPNYKLNKKAAFAAGFSGMMTVVKNRLAAPMRSCRFVLLFSSVNGGFNNTFSILETLAQLKFVEVSEKGIYSFRFKASGVETTTFNGDDDDDAGRGNPSISARDEWPAFYQAHRDDIDALWEKAKTATFADAALPEDGSDGEDGDEDGNDIDDEDDAPVRAKPSRLSRSARDVVASAAEAAAVVVVSDES
jgi:RecA/RadA recombinase